MFTLWCISVVLATPFAVGLPLVLLLGRCRGLTPSARISAPFLGVCGLIVVLQNLVYLHIPIAQSTPFLWLVIGGQPVQVPVSAGANRIILTAIDAPVSAGESTLPGLLATGLRFELPLLPDRSTRPTQTAENSKQREHR